MADPKYKKLFDKEMDRKQFLKFSAIALISLFGVAGAISKLLSAAESPYATSNAEAGKLTGGATLVSNSSSASGEVVTFEAPTVTTTGMPICVSMGYDPDLFGDSDAGLSQYKIMKAAGFYGVRIDAIYNGDPLGYDATIRAALSAGLDVLLILDGYQTSDGTASFTSFCTSVVKTYEPLGVHHYEILNEENGNGNWDGDLVNPAAYADLLKSTYSAIKAADSKSVVILGGLAVFMDGDGANEGNGNYEGSCLPGTFMTQFYAHTGGTSEGYFDALGIHPYPGNQLPTTGNNWGVFLNPPGENGYYGESVRAIMVANGDTNKQMWITEYGSDISGTLEAQIYTNGLTLAKGMSYVGAFYCFNWNDDQDGTYGMVDSSYNAKPALAAVEAFL
jgi:hypothetical protein